ncbi:polyphosphate polymerase domain-containing protein [Actinoplanes sp. NPDC026619]|uniref:polyphosphate polymerase domain-containing protein n=1 Tax=Actinoplanes sp. NPDC026619 TaxID=3155798 RepID=UPI0034043815
MSALATLEPISLDELLEKASLQTRVDRKYVLPLSEALDLPARLGGQARVLEIDGQRTFRYRSTYFDTHDLISFRLAAHRRRRRFKVRTRTYLDSALCWLEVKTEGYRGGTVKDRLPYQTCDHETVTPGRWFVDDILGTSVGSLTPVLTTNYRRATLHVFADDSRVTIDTSLSWTDPSGFGLHLPQLAIVETKTRSAASPVDRLLWADGRRPVRISKYATGLAALRPELPANRWGRTLRRYFV